METLTIEPANALPAPTWHRLGVNDVNIELPVLEAAQKVEVQAEKGLRGGRRGVRGSFGRNPLLPLHGRHFFHGRRRSRGSTRHVRKPIRRHPLANPPSLPTSAAHQVDGQESPAAAKDGRAAIDGGATTGKEAAIGESVAIDKPALSSFQMEALEARHLSPCRRLLYRDGTRGFRVP